MASFNIKITFDIEEGYYLVFVEGISDLYGSGNTESAALLDFLQRYELEYAGYKCFNSGWIRNKITELQLAEEI